MLYSDTQTGFVRLCMWLCSERSYRPQHTTGRLIKQLIKARELGSDEAALVWKELLDSPRKRRERKERAGRVERERVSEPSAKNVSKSALASPPPPLCLLVCLCVEWGRHSLYFVPVWQESKTSGNSSNHNQLRLCRDSSRLVEKPHTEPGARLDVREQLIGR